MIAALIALLGGLRGAIFAALAVVALALAGAQTLRLHAAQLDAATARTALADLRADLADARADASASARAVEAIRAQAAAAAAEQYEQGKLDAQTAADRVVAGLNAGTVRLRREWAGCETSRLSAAAARAAEPDAADRLRAASAGRIVRAVAECQAQRDGLMALVRADRSTPP